MGEAEDLRVSVSFFGGVRLFGRGRTMRGWQPRGLSISYVVFGRWLQPSGCQRWGVLPVEFALVLFVRQPASNGAGKRASLQVGREFRERLRFDVGQQVRPFSDAAGLIPCCDPFLDFAASLAFVECAGWHAAVQRVVVQLQGCELVPTAAAEEFSE